MRQTLEGKLVPDNLRGKIREYGANYVLYDHVLSGGENPKRMDHLGLTGVRDAPLRARW